MSDYKATDLYAVASVFIGLGVITLGLRFWARRRQSAALLADDWLMIPALATYIGACAALFFGVHLHVFGYSSHDMTKADTMATLERSGKAQIAINLSSIFCRGCAKMSILFFYKRIFCVAGRKAILNVIVVFSIVIMACWTVTFVFLMAFQCGTHFSAPWEGTSAKYCVYSYPALLGESISDFLLDVWVLVLPIYPIMMLHATKSKRLAITATFLLACIGVAASIARMVLFIQIHNLGRDEIRRTDLERSLSRVSFYSILEMGVAVVAVNLPSIWLLFTSVTPDAILRSIRSVVSLASLGSRGSRGSRGSQKSHNLSNAEALKSNASSSSFAPIAGSSAEAEVSANPGVYEMGNARKGHDQADVPTGHIKVRRSVEQTSGALHHTPA